MQSKSLPNNYPGKRIGLYEIVKEIGNGAFGKVYLVKKENVKNGSQKFYALKCILKSRFFECNGLIRRLVENEKQILLKLKGCKNVIQLYEYMESMNQVYFVMKYCNGGDLANYLEQNPGLKLDDLLALIRQIIEGYHQLHINRVIHRDLKPQNILIHEKSIIKISDLGLAHQLSNDEDYIEKNYGTLGYKAPEVILGQKYNETADIFSLGVLIYRMIFRKQPFPCQTQYSFIISCRDQNPPPMVNIPNELRSLLTSMLEYDAKKRLKWSELYESVVIFPNKQVNKVLHPIDYVNGQKDFEQNKRDYVNMEKQQDCNRLSDHKELQTIQLVQQLEENERIFENIEASKHRIPNANVHQKNAFTKSTVNSNGDQQPQQNQIVACQVSKSPASDLEKVQQGPQNQQSAIPASKLSASNLEKSQQRSQIKKNSAILEPKSPPYNLDDAQQQPLNQKPKLEKSKSCNEGSQAEQQVILMESCQLAFQISEKPSRKPVLLEGLKLYQQQTEPLSFLIRFFFLFLRKLNFERNEPILTHIILADYLICKYLQDQFCQLNRMLSLRKNFLNLSERSFEELYNSVPFQAYRKDVVSTIDAIDLNFQYYSQTLDQNKAKVETHVDKTLVEKINSFRNKSSSSEEVGEILKELMNLLQNKFGDIVKSHQHVSTVFAERNKDCEQQYSNFKKAQYMCHTYQKIISPDPPRKDLISPEDLERMPDQEIDELLEKLERIQ